MVNGTLAENESPYPATADPALLEQLANLQYSCTRTPPPGGNHPYSPDSGHTAAQELAVPEGSTFEGFLEVQIQSPTPGASEVAYTLDGSVPSLMHGRRVPAGWWKTCCVLPVM